MRAAALHLLGDRPDVAIAAFKGARIEYRRRARRIIDKIGNFFRFVNAVGRRQANAHPLIDRQRLRLQHCRPDIFKFGDQESPRGVELCLRQGALVLHNRILLQNRLRKARTFVDAELFKRF